MMISLAHGCLLEIIKHIWGSDQRVQFVRWRYETIFSLVTAVVMVAIALSVIIDGIKSLLNPASRVVPQPVALIGAGSRQLLC